jgi:hypothetical protein
MPIWSFFSSLLLHNASSLWLFSILIMLGLLDQHASAIQMVYNTSVPITLSNACSQALLSDTACDPVVRNFRPGFFYSPETLNRVCTSTCGSSLNSYRTAVQSACGTETLTGSFDLEMSVLIVPGTYQYLYESICLQDNGRYCNNVAATAAAIADPGSMQFRGSACTPHVPPALGPMARPKLTEHLVQIVCSITSILSPQAQLPLAPAIRAWSRVFGFRLARHISTAPCSPACLFTSQRPPAAELLDSH